MTKNETTNTNVQNTSTTDQRGSGEDEARACQTAAELPHEQQEDAVPAYEAFLDTYVPVGDSRGMSMRDSSGRWMVDSREGAIGNSERWPVSVKRGLSVKDGEGWPLSDSIWSEWR